MDSLPKRGTSLRPVYPIRGPASSLSFLFDPDGYLMVNDLSSLANNPYINVGKQVSIPQWD